LYRAAVRSFLVQTTEDLLDVCVANTLGRNLLALQSGLDHLGQPDAVCNFRVDDRGGLDFFPIQSNRCNQ
jgi:hypothetical protein